MHSPMMKIVLILSIGKLKIVGSQGPMFYISWGFWGVLLCVIFIVTGVGLLVAFGFVIVLGVKIGFLMCLVKVGVIFFVLLCICVYDRLLVDLWFITLWFLFIIRGERAEDCQ